jgi:biotin carboxyl carrier protein
MLFNTIINDQLFHVEVDRERSVARINDEKLKFEIVEHKNGRIILRSGTKIYKFDNICVNGSNVSFAMNGSFFDAKVKDEKDLLLEKLGFENHTENKAGDLRAPMPGKILEIMIQQGDKVSAGQPLIILEAMKMENELKAPAGGEISSLLVNTGENVEKNQHLLVISPSG